MKFQSIIYPFLVAAQSVAATSSHLSSTTSSSIKSFKPARPLNVYEDSNDLDIISVIHKFRGGAVDAPKKKKKNTKSSKTKVDTSKKATQQIDTTTTDEGEDVEAKSVINTAMKDSDAANSLGDAIRARAHILRKDKLPFQERTFDSALVSLGLSLGTAGLDVDEDSVIDTNREEEEEEDGRSPTMMAYYQYGHRSSIQQNQQFVPPSTSAVIANYFLKTHGGTHLIQCILSLLASVLGMACLVLPSFPSAAAAVVASSTTKTSITSSQLSRRILLSASKYQLLQQTLLLAMAKHASALVGAVIIGAQRIPTLGVRNARRHLEMVALDPVGQYLFYCSILVVWMGWFGGSKSGMDFVSELRRSVVSIQNSASAAMGSSSSGGESGNSEVEAMSKLLDVLSQSSPPWFLSQSHGGAILPIIMLAPILLREVISILWVVSDVLSLAFSTSGGITGKFCQGILSSARSILDTFMCIVISSDQWKNADSFQRQRSLARLVSQTSLLLELIVGIVLFGDGVQAFWGFSFGGSTNGGVGGTRLPLKVVAGKLACANLYINFLLSRRKKIHELVGSIRSTK